MHQHINYEEHLPILLGKSNDLVRKTNEDSPEPLENKFAPNQGDPSIRNEFTVAGYRWGHPQVTNEFDLFIDGDLGTSKLRTEGERKGDRGGFVLPELLIERNFFDPDIVYKHGPGACLRGAMMHDTGIVSSRFWPSLQHNLFKPTG